MEAAVILYYWLFSKMHTQ